MRFTRCKTLNEMVEKAREQKMELDFRTKQKPKQEHTVVGQAKKSKTSESPSKGYEGRGWCAKCGKSHSRACRVAGSGCYSCGQSGHVIRDCPKKGLICFHCNQTGHKRVNCPMLQGGGGAMATPAPNIMRITDGLPTKADSPTMKSRAF